MSILRKWMRLVEAFDHEQDEYDDDDEPSFDHLKPSSEIRRFLPALAQAAQSVYDSWDQSDPDNDDLAGGGICHLIADKMSNILGGAGMNVGTVSAWHEVHVYCVGQFSDGVFEIDIPYSYYEKGGGYTWYKIPNVVFSADMVHVQQLDHNPENIGQYTDWEN